MLKFGKLFEISSSWSTDKSFSVPGAARGYVDPTLNFGTPFFSWSTDRSRLTCVLNGAVDIVYGETRMIGLTYSEKNYDDMLSRFHLIPERHGHTDGQTDRFAISISCVSMLTCCTTGKSINYRINIWGVRAMDLQHDDRFKALFLHGGSNRSEGTLQF